MPLERQPVDAEGVTLPHDHPELLSEDLIVRLVPAQWRIPTSTTRWRLSSQAFGKSSDKYGGCSVLILRLIEEDGADIVDVVNSRGMLGAIGIPVGSLRSKNLQVGYDPLPADAYHGQIWGNLTRGTANSLLALAHWVVAIPDTVIVV